MTQRKYYIGNLVKAIAFEDCFGKQHSESQVLTVTREIEVKGLHPHYRITATDSVNPYVYVEAAETAFIDAAVTQGN